MDHQGATAPTDRPVTAGPSVLRKSVLGPNEPALQKVEPGPKFLGQFPYKSCQRSLTPKKVTGHKWPYNLAPASAPKRRVSLKRRQVAGRVEDSSFAHIPSASRPTSPDAQLEKLRKVAAEQREMTVEEVERYKRYLAEDIKEENIERMGKEQLELIKAKCNHPAWFKSLMLKKKVGIRMTLCVWKNSTKKEKKGCLFRQLIGEYLLLQVSLLDQEVKEGYVEASKEAVLNYIMLDQVLAKVLASFSKSLSKSFSKF